MLNDAYDVVAQLIKIHVSQDPLNSFLVKGSTVRVLAFASFTDPFRSSHVKKAERSLHHLACTFVELRQVHKRYSMRPGTLLVHLHACSHSLTHRCLNHLADISRTLQVHLHHPVELIILR